MAPRVSLLLFGCAGLLLAAPLVRQGAGRAPAPRSAPPEEALAKSPAAAIDFFPAYAALDPSAPDDADTLRIAFNPADPYGGLPQDDGYDLVAAWCSSCHSLRIVMQQRLAPERWDFLLDWMVERQGMAEPDAQTRAAILGYLQTHFSGE